MKSIIFFTFGFCHAACSALANNERLLVGTFSSPPYQVVDNGVISGNTAETFTCILDTMGTPYDVTVYPQARAKLYFKKSTIDALFSIGEDENISGIRSAPITIEKWYWLSNFTLDSLAELPENKRIGAVNGSAQLTWLRSQGVENIRVVNHQKQLEEMFIVNRIDAFIIDRNELTISDKWDELLNRHVLHWKFIKYVPRKAIFSHNKVIENPTFIQQFNALISDCGPPVLQLSKCEELGIVKKLQPILQQVKTNSEIIAILQRGEDVAKSHLAETEAQWRREKDSQQGPLFERVTRSPAALYLANLQAQSDGLISEIIVMDESGYAVAVSKVTSDLYQGDEDKFTHVQNQQSNGVFVDSIKFDESTQGFQTQVSFRLGENELLGAITFGVDVEKAKQSIQFCTPGEDSVF